MRLEQYLTKRKLSINEFGRRLGVAPSTVLHWVHGRYTPKPDMIEAVRVATKDAVSFKDWIKPKRGKRHVGASSRT